MFSPLEAWFAARQWTVFPFQRAAWEEVVAGRSGLLHSTTGTGKTYAALLGAVARARAEDDRGGGLRVLWISPLRALAADTEAALTEPLTALWPHWTVARRTGDTTASARRKLSQRPAEVLVTTPESLALLLSQPGFLPHFTTLRMVVVDEWHEFLSTKRGVLLELALARLRTLAPTAANWGLSATLGNTSEAATVLGGLQPDGTPRPVTVLAGRVPKTVTVTTLLPPPEDRYPWAGHLGLRLLPAVQEVLRRHRTSILFTNTRSQAELWFRALSESSPEWHDRVGLHHGSLAPEVRAAAEDGLRSGHLRAVVATSSLDLGVDFAPVDAVLQVGSPKGVARLLQRAGRSGHRPGAPSRIFCVPANTWELVEIAAARDLVTSGTVEPRHPLRQPLDVLCQHLCSTAAGGERPGSEGFSEESLRREVRTTHAYRDLADDAWAWALDFAARGGASLHRYEQFARMRHVGGRFVLRDEPTARRHRLDLGTITAEAALTVQFANGQRLGSVEESFVTKLRPGDRFLFAGRSLELVRVRDLRAVVRAARAGAPGVPRWMGGKLPLSTCLSEGVRHRLDRAKAGTLDSPEMDRLAGILVIQARLSHIPAADELLIETHRSREGHHIFLYPFEGRLVHEGLAALFAYRLGRHRPLSCSLAVNDYGCEILCSAEPPLDEALADGLFSDENLVADILGSLNAAELARRRFREIARIAGLTPEGVGRARKSTRQLQVSSSLLFDVFQRYEPSNRLLHQATGEVLESQFEETRLRATLASLRSRRLVRATLPSVSPFAYPLFLERLREQLSSEKLSDRIARMELQMESVPAEKGKRGTRR
jgi:ATP-dependent Lhr-like helicase